MAAAGQALAACGDGAATRLELARSACMVTMQALYAPFSDKEPVKFERVESVSADREKFEFVWKTSQIHNLLFRVTLPEIPEAERNYRVVIEGGPEREYICRGSLTARALHGVWTRRGPASESAREIKLTQHPIDF